MPILQNLQNLINCGPVSRVRYQYDMYQIFHFLTNPFVNVGIVCWHEVLCIEDADLATVLVRVVIKTQRKDDATQHPDVDLRVYAEFHVLVYHFGWPIHHGGILFKIIKLIVNLLRVAALPVIEHRLARRSEIAEAECLVLLI